MDSIYANLPHPDDFEAYLNENRDWYFSLCYSKIKENHEGDKLEEIDIMTFNSFISFLHLFHRFC